MTARQRLSNWFPVFLGGAYASFSGDERKRGIATLGAKEKLPAPSGKTRPPGLGGQKGRNAMSRLWELEDER